MSIGKDGTETRGQEQDKVVNLIKRRAGEVEPKEWTGLRRKWTGKADMKAEDD